MSCRGSMVLAQGLSLHEPPAKPASKEPLRSLCLFWGEKSCPPLKKHEMHQNAWNQWRKHIETWGDDIKWRKYDQMIKSLSMCKKGWTMCIFDMSLADVVFGDQELHLPGWSAPHLGDSISQDPGSARKIFRIGDEIWGKRQGWKRMEKVDINWCQLSIWASLKSWRHETYWKMFTSPWWNYEGATDPRNKLAWHTIRIKQEPKRKREYESALAHHWSHFWASQ